MIPSGVQKVAVMLNKHILAAELTGTAGSDATDEGQVGMMEDGQLDGQTTTNSERRQTQRNQVYFKQEVNVTKCF